MADLFLFVTVLGVSGRYCRGWGISRNEHPDLGGDHWNAALINEAYAVISDSRKRAEYDRARLLTNAASTVNEQRVKEPATQVPPPNPGREYPPGMHDSCAFCGTTHQHGNNPRPEAACRECASPLKSIEKLRLEKSCRRMVHRIAKHIQIVFYTAWPQEKGFTGVVQDISPRGMQFFTNNLPETGMHIKVECEMCTVVARVTNYEQRAAVLGVGWLVGVEFLTILFRETRGSFVSLRI